MTPDEKREAQRLRNARPENIQRRSAYAHTPVGRERAREAGRRYVERHPERELARRSTPEFRARAAEASRRSYAAHREERLVEMRAYQLMDRFKLTVQQYDAMLAVQGGGCAVCGAVPDPEARNKNLAVDHDRNCCPGPKSCGFCVRGLLCSNCNVAIGLLGDSEERILAMLAYLRASRGCQS